MQRTNNCEDQFISEHTHNMVLYRYEKGHWWYPIGPFVGAFQPPNDINRQLSVPSPNMPEAFYASVVEKLYNNGYTFTPYIFPIEGQDVFSEYCTSGAIGGTGERARLAFNELTPYNLGIWAHFHGVKNRSPITIVQFTLNKPACLAENYISNVSSTDIFGITRLGCPDPASRAQGITGREFVLKRDDIVSVNMLHETFVWKP